MYAIELFFYAKKCSCYNGVAADGTNAVARAALPATRAISARYRVSDGRPRAARGGKRRAAARQMRPKQGRMSAGAQSADTDKKPNSAGMGRGRAGRGGGRALGSGKPLACGRAGGQLCVWVGGRRGRSVAHVLFHRGGQKKHAARTGAAACCAKSQKWRGLWLPKVAKQRQ